MKPVEVARQAAGILSGQGVTVTVERVPGMPNYQTLAWLGNGFGVSLVVWPVDVFPELKIKRRGEGADWAPPRQVRIGMRGMGKASDGHGIIRDVTPAEVAAVLATLNEWRADGGA